MFLLHIKAGEIKKRNLIESIYFKNFIKNVNIINKDLVELRKNQNYKNSQLNVLGLKNLDFKSQNTIKYILGISLTNTNIIVSLTNIKGIVRYFCTSGFIGINRVQKNKKIIILIKLLKFTMTRVIFFGRKDSVALHIKNCNQQIASVISSFLTKYYNLELIKITNNHCHNGCRPRKIKRKKKRKLNFEKFI